jgi:hypothetical protein
LFQGFIVNQTPVSVLIPKTGVFLSGIATLESRTDQQVPPALHETDARLTTSEAPEDAYRPVIETENHRIALNSLTQTCINEARRMRREVIFTSIGVDALGSARRYNELKDQYGDADIRTQEAKRVFVADARTGLFEETEDLHYFSESYPMVEGSVLMGSQSWEQLAANGNLDDRAAPWYLSRSFLETREALSSKEVDMSIDDIVTISNTSRAPGSEDYFTGEDCMIRFISLDKATGMMRINQLMMKDLDNKILAKLFEKLGVETDTSTIPDTLDSSTEYLATQIKVKKGELTHGAADIAYLIDTIATQETGEDYLFGIAGEKAEENPYAEIYALSRNKEARRTEATEYLTSELSKLAADQPVNVKDSLRRVFESARSIVANIEGDEFVEQSYGSAAAAIFRQKQQALEQGDWQAVADSERSMQREMGDIVVCGQRLAAALNNELGGDGEESCARLPEPGEKAKCPDCHEVTIVGGSKDSIKCSEPGCKLEDPKLRHKRQVQERSERANKIAAQRRANRKERNLAKSKEVNNGKQKAT